MLSRANSTVQIFIHIAGSTMTYGAIPYMAQIFHRGESLAPVLTLPACAHTIVGPSLFPNMTSSASARMRP